MKENQYVDKKSLKIVLGKHANFIELVKDCVAFANARGGTIYIGIEDLESVPISTQIVPIDLPNIIVKRLAELSINLNSTAKIITAENGGQIIELTVYQSASTIASTTDGKYYIRIDDICKPVLPDELMRLITDKPSFIWETKLTNVLRKDVDKEKLYHFINSIKSSERVSTFVKDKTIDDLLDYYLMTDGQYLTNLGVLWIGNRIDRARLLYAPVVQFLKYDDQGNRVNKLVWDDYSLNPYELLEAIWTEIPDWREGVEVSDGLFRKNIPNYEEEVIRELITNALVHRPYTTRGDIFINLFPNRLEIHNPGSLPLGVTINNILHKSVRRNEHLAKVFYDLKLMEREGSGYDKVFEILLSNGKQIPVTLDVDDRVTVVLNKQPLKTEVIKLINRANENFALKQKEIISLGLIAQHTSLSALELTKILQLKDSKFTQNWLGRLLDIELVKTKGRTKGVEYFINPDFLKKIDFKGKTNLKKIENHSLNELIYQDLLVYSYSSISEIHHRIGVEIPIRRLKTQLLSLKNTGKICSIGKLKGTKYFIDNKD